VTQLEIESPKGVNETQSALTPTPDPSPGGPARGRGKEIGTMARLTLLACQLLVAMVVIGLWQLLASD
jgi:hypothetical protein